MKNASHDKKSAEKQARIRAVLAFMTEHGPATAEQISKQSGWTIGTTKKRLQDMRNDGLVHIAEWVHVEKCGQRAAAYGVGNRMDVPLPISARGLLEAAKKLSLEAQATAEAKLRHAKQMRNWKPHRDVAAAWF